MTIHLFNRDSTGIRTDKPRNHGLTMVMDKGLGPQAFADCLQLAAPYIDFVKLGFGTMSLTPVEIVKQKLELAQQHQVELYPGGTFFEYFSIHGQAEKYFASLAELGFTTVEISDGSIDLSANERSRLISIARSFQLRVITEMGKKAAGTTYSLEQCQEIFAQDIAAGAEFVIVEGRESGENIGIYNANGDTDQAYVEEMVQRVDGTKLIWETPQKKQQITLLQLLGVRVNLGNIHSDDILSLEALRRGLRGDTFLWRG